MPGEKTDLLTCFNQVKKRDVKCPDTEELEDLNVPACPEEAGEVVEVLHVESEVFISLETANETEPPKKF